MKYVIGTDIGTSACKTIVLDGNGKIAAAAEQQYQPRYGIDGSCVIDPEQWYAAVCGTIRRCMADGAILPEDIAAVACSGQQQSTTFIGNDGFPVRDSIVWQDLSPVQESQYMNEAFGDVFRHECHLPCDPSLTVSKIRWLMEHESENWKKTNCFLFTTGYVVYRLTGAFSANRTDLSASGLNSVERDSWSDDLFFLAGIDLQKRPPVFDCFSVVSTVSAAAARETGLLQGTPVMAGSGDAAAENYSVGVAGRSALKLRLGSAAAASVLTPRENTPPLVGVPFVDPSYLQIGTYMKTCGTSVKWLRDVFFSELPKDSAYDLMDQEAEKCQPTSEHLMYHPYLNGEHAPYADSSLRAKFTGINSGHRRGDFVIACYEGVSFGIRGMIEAIPALSKAEEVAMIGGGTKSRLWTEILADVLGKNCRILQHRDAAFGAALIAGQSAHLFDTDRILKAASSSGQNIFFADQRHAYYDELYCLFQQRVY